MVISVAEARAAAEREDWHRILGLGGSAGLPEVRKAKCALQRVTHTDKGGDGELCKLINMAADKLEDELDFDRSERRKAQYAEEERRAREEERRTREARARAESEERWRRQCEAHVRHVRERRTKSNWLMVEKVHQRTRNKITLGAFPVVYRRVSSLHGNRKSCQARVLVYAVETEIAARRAAREHTWPKTSGLDKRCPDHAAELTGFKRAYDKAYQSLRYLRNKGKLHGHVLLTTRRLMREAWMVYLAMPAPVRDDVVRHA